MLMIQNKEKLMDAVFLIGDTEWRVESVVDRGFGVYHITLRCKQTDVFKKYILTKEENFVAEYANYKITDSDDRFKSVWVNRANVGSVTSMLRTLRRIISHANNP